MILDTHTHAFPDSIAARAIARLEVGNCKACHNGTISGLLRSMDAAGTDQSVICSIATKPEQFAPILRWSLSVASDRLIPLASIHPADPDAVARVREVRDSGLKGIKLHPYYQDFDLAAESMNPLYEAVSASGLIVIAHTGFDMAFPRDGRASPEKILSVTTRFPELRFVATHFGAWQDWAAVENCLIGKPLMMEISLALEDLPVEVARRMILAHSPDHLLFGTDSPWGEPSEALRRLLALNLDDGLLQKILWGNAARILAISGNI
jgi:predicted TIM-barrel fold metal-dependent hydrolase